jgi:hypothetical protein
MGMGSVGSVEEGELAGHNSQIHTFNDQKGLNPELVNWQQSRIFCCFDKNGDEKWPWLGVKRQLHTGSIC